MLELQKDFYKYFVVPDNRKMEQLSVHLKTDTGRSIGQF